MAILTEEQIAEELSQIDGWTRKGDEIMKSFKNKDFLDSLGFVTKVAILAEKANHHPDIFIQWNKVTLTLSTHSEGGITGKDMTLANEINEL